ncbi:chromosome transmission fidelity protein 8 [Oryza glaberrima]|nr:chromosome transmission fidelity protein 8 [Oryza glaberrima]
MQIRVRCGCGEAGCPEWAIVEVQGVVQPQPCFSGRIQGLHIGRLCAAAAAPSSKAAFTFTVGYHELAGTKVALKKPLLVLRKKKTTAVAAETELEVIGVIRHKILFKDRPKALISKPQVKEKKTLPLPAPAAAPPPQSS